jgi:hypothetical protein
LRDCACAARSCDDVLPRDIRKAEIQDHQIEAFAIERRQGADAIRGL